MSDGPSLLVRLTAYGILVSVILVRSLKVNVNVRVVPWANALGRGLYSGPRVVVHPRRHYGNGRLEWMGASSNHWGQG